MTNVELNNFLTLIRSQFKEDSGLITETTDLKMLKEWSSLQTMIIVSEIDKEYNVILNFEDMKKAKTVAELFAIVQTKLN